MTGPTAIGVACGLGAAGLQSVAYVASRHYTHTRGLPGTPAGRRAGASLLLLMHLWLGGMAVVTLALVWTAGVPWGRVSGPLVGAAACNILGQAALTVAIEFAVPSRVSPLLTFKVFCPAVLGAVLGQPVGRAASGPLTGWQWAALCLCVGAAVSISRAGGRMRRTAAGAIAFTVLIFAASDWCVGLTVGRLLAVPGVTPLRASLLAVSALYGLTGVAAVTWWAVRRPVLTRADWRDALPYAACWYGAMVVLFVAFAEVGLVLGTILQCTRSFLTIGLGVGLMYLGYAHIEPRQPRRVVVQRVAAGVVMFAAIALYIVRDPVAAWAGR